MVDPAVLVEKIRRTGAFGKSPRLPRLLAYLLTENEAGRGDAIKASTIAIEVFGRDTAFDPQTDSIVRVEMGRLRRSLERYYLSAGIEDKVRIGFLPGSYRPVITRLDMDAAGVEAAEAPVSSPAVEPIIFSSAQAPPVQARKSSLVAIAAISLFAVLAGAVWWFGFWLGTNEPFRVGVMQPRILGEIENRDSFENGIQTEFIAALSRKPAISVSPIERDWARRPHADRTGFDLVVSADITIREAQATVDLIVFDPNLGVVGTQTTSVPFDPASIEAKYRSLAADVARLAGRDFGLVDQAAIDVVSTMAGSSVEAMDCYFLTLHFFQVYSPNALSEAQTCIQRKRGGINSGPLLAAQAFIELITARFGDADFAAALDEFERLGSAAMDVSPGHWLARSASYTEHLCRGEEEDFVDDVTRYLSEEPLNQELWIDVAAKYGMGLGRFDESRLLFATIGLARAETRPWGGLPSAMEALVKGDFARVGRVLPVTETRGFPEAALLRMTAAAAMGDTAAARRNADLLALFGIDDMAKTVRFLERTCWSEGNRTVIERLLFEHDPLVSEAFNALSPAD